MILCSLPILSLAIAGCGDDATTSPTTTGGYTGTLHYENVGSGVHRYSFASGVETSLFAGRSPGVLPSGEIVVLGPYAQTLELVNATGTSRSEIYTAAGSYSLFEPKASPDGSRIAFTFSDDHYDSVRTIVITKTGEVIAEFTDLGSPSWLSDGRLVMSGSWRYPYSITARTITPGGNASIFLSNAALTTAAPIGTPLDNPLNPAVSPDGTRIAFELNSHIWAMKIDGSDIRQITTGTKVENTPSWSPDGKHIACICFGTYEVSYYNAIAIVPSNPTVPTDMVNTNTAIWPLDKNALSESSKGRLNGTDYVTWKP